LAGVVVAILGISAVFYFTLSSSSSSSWPKDHMPTLAAAHADAAANSLC